MGKKQQKKKKESFFVRVNNLLTRTIHFITYDIWRITGNEVTGLKQLGINTTKTMILAIRSFIDENLGTKASALTYSTLLAIVPLLAVLLGIAKGFGFQDIVRQALIDYFPGHNPEFNKAFDFVESYLAHAQGGLFVGIGLILLFYTVINLISSIEETFNDIWQIQKSRPIHRKLIDYMALFLILPILMTASSGISIFVSSLHNSFLSELIFFTPFVDITLKVAPYILTSLVFTALYVFLPNTKVQFIYGLIAGTVTGCAFQFFQFLYISGQIWVTKYNAIYGSFAALPLLLLWLQLSWLICLFGASLAFAAQNVQKFSFERDSKNISRRYKDFITLLIASLIIKRFEKGEKPYTADELSEEYRIPIRITSQVLYLLMELDIIIEVKYGEDDRVIYYQPAIDINQISVNYLLSRIEKHGSENFKIDTQELFHKEWQTLLKTREDMMTTQGEILLKDI